MPFGVLVTGPPGSGKTTCVHGLSLFLRACGRDVCTVNLDPAVIHVPYPCDVDIKDLVCLDEVQEELSLGPNGGLLYCFDYLEKNYDWLQVKFYHIWYMRTHRVRTAGKHSASLCEMSGCLQEKLQPHLKANKYLLFDCPGQAELFMCHGSFKSLVQTIAGKWHVNLTALQLVDSHLCTTPHTYLSALLMCLTSMLNFEVPYVNVLSKVRIWYS